MSSSTHETFSMLQQKYLTKKTEALHLRKEYLEMTFTPIESPHPLIPKIPHRTEEEFSRLRQAKLAHILKRTSACRLLGEEDQYKTVRKCAAGESMDSSWADPGVREFMFPKREGHWVLQLPHVTLEGTLGTLEARGSGFTFTAPDFHMHFKDTIVKGCFFLHGDGERPHQLLFHLHHHMMVGTKEMKNILFSLAKQASDTDRGSELDNFVRSVGRAVWDSYAMFCVVHDLNKFKFIGHLPLDRSATISLTSSALVLLTAPPFYVVPLNDVEFVNLAQVESAPMTAAVLDMTVVFKDYSQEVFKICTVDIAKLAGIKRILNFAGVKYYCNSRKLDVKEWNSILRGIVESPKKFIECGGWESLHLEDELTLSCYGIAKEPEYTSGVFQ